MYLARRSGITSTRPDTVPTGCSGWTMRGSPSTRLPMSWSCSTSTCPTAAVSTCCASCAAGNAVPVIITTAQDQVAIRIEGLNSGADDYLVKPFDLSELTARIAAVARRYAASPLPGVEVNGVTVDLGRRTVAIAGEPVPLTAREWAVLERLLRHRGAIVTKAEIEDSLYQFGAEIESNAVEVYVSRLRKKLGRDFVTTARGMGYQVASGK